MSYEFGTKTWDFEIKSALLSAAQVKCYPGIINFGNEIGKSDLM